MVMVTLVKSLSHDPGQRCPNFNLFDPGLQMSLVVDYLSNKGQDMAYLLHFSVGIES